MLNNDRAIGDKRVKVIGLNVDIPLKLGEKGGIYPVVGVCCPSSVLAIELGE
jgi:hypothetical protein